MPSTTVGIRELKSRLSYYLQQVKAGNTLITTEHNRPIGKIAPPDLAIDERRQVAEVHLAIRSHGPILSDVIADQLSTFNGGCPPNTCGNVQIAVFPSISERAIND